MKLLNKTVYMFITIMLVVFFLGSIGFYYMLKSASEKEILLELKTRVELIENEFQSHPEIYRNLTIPGYISVIKIDEFSQLKNTANDTLLADPSDGMYKHYKYLSTEIQIDSEIFRITSYKSLIESNELIERITLIVTIIIILFIVFLYLLNRFMFQQIWSDFFRTLKKLKSFDVNNENMISFSPSEIYEFDQLNSALNQMIAKIRIDYENMKEFSGNISHEIQTPLTIIRQKSELLLQTEPLNKKQFELINDIQKTNSRLARLNKTLVLLSKIENKQFVNKEDISILRVLKNHIENFISISSSKKLKWDINFEDDLTISAEPSLIDSLLVNLIKNAVYHNIINGEINILLTNKEFIISNTGEDKDLSNTQIFDRYSKTNMNSESLGLGLAIVKKICNLYGYAISYQYQDSKHVFVLGFEQK